MGKDPSAIKQEIEQTRDRMGDTVEALAYKADVGSRVKEGVAERVEAMKQTIGGAVENVKSAVNGSSESVTSLVTERAQDGSEAVAEKTRRVVGIARENPLGLAIAGLALGFLAGSLVPVSDMERERLGPIRDKVVDQTQAATQNLVEAGKAVVADAAQSVVSSAQSHTQEVVKSAMGRNA